MMWRMLNGVQQGHFINLLPSNNTTNYVPSGGGSTGSSDIGRLMFMSSNLGACYGTSDYLCGTTEAASNTRFAGILAGVECDLDYSSSATHGSTACKYKVQPVLAGDILEVDYSTHSSNDTGSTGKMASTGTTGDMYTTNIGAYFKIGYSSGGTTSAAKFALAASYLNATTCVNAPTSGNFFKLIDFSTKEKTAIVMYDPPITT